MRIKFKPAVLALLVLLSLLLPHGAAAGGLKPPPPPKAVWVWIDVLVGDSFVLQNKANKEVFYVEAQAIYDKDHTIVDPPAPRGGKGYNVSVHARYTIYPDGVSLDCTFGVKQLPCGLLRADGSEVWPNGRQKTGLERQNLWLTGNIWGVTVKYDANLWRLPEP